MDLYNTLVSYYNAFLSIFPPSLQWLVTLIILISLGAALFSLIRQNILFLILLVVLLPFLLPIIFRFFADLIAFLVYLFDLLRASVPGS